MLLRFILDIELSDAMVVILDVLMVEATEVYDYEGIQ